MRQFKQIGFDLIVEIDVQIKLLLGVFSPLFVGFLLGFFVFAI